MGLCFDEPRSGTQFRSENDPSSLLRASPDRQFKAPGGPVFALSSFTGFLYLIKLKSVDDRYPYNRKIIHIGEFFC
jgi:hypothetical protein